MAGHEEQDVRPRGSGGAADVTKCLETAHDIQSASLVDQAGVQRRNQVTRQQDERSSSSPRFQVSQRYPTEHHTERQHRVDEPELLVRKQTVNHKCPDDCCQQNLVSFEGDGAPMEKEWKMRADHDSKPLSEVPVPGMRAVEISHAIEDVKPQEVELHHGPLFIEYAVDHS